MASAFMQSSGNCVLLSDPYIVSLCAGLAAHLWAMRRWSRSASGVACEVSVRAYDNRVLMRYIQAFRVSVLSRKSSGLQTSNLADELDDLFGTPTASTAKRMSKSSKDA